MNTKRKINNVSGEYFSQQAARNKSITPSQKKALVNKLRQELSRNGRMPLLTGPVRLDITHPMVKAAILAAYTISGQYIKRA